MSQLPPRPGVSPIVNPASRLRSAKTRLVALGSPIQWSESDMAALADINAADLKSAEALWQRDAPGSLKQLLQAQVMEPGEES